MPFSGTTPEHTEEYWTSHYEDFLKPTLEEIKNIEVTRSEPLRGDLLKNIIFNLVNSDIVIADLTDSNPNVYWELGIRHSFKNGTITIKDDSYTLPFDLSRIGTLTYYPKNHTENVEFQSQLKGAIADWLFNPYLPDSFVLEIVGRDIYENSRCELLRHTSLIKTYFRYLTDPDKVDDSLFHIQVEIDTIKHYLGKFYQYCHESVKKNIEELSDKGTIIEGFSMEELLQYRRSIFHWMSLVNDVRLNIFTRMDKDLNFSLFEF